jgi:RHS repeat-associated protein
VAVDRLGSVRNVGPAWYFPIDYFPYGEERTSTANGTDKFGTYFRDGYGQDYADQRYYTSNFGRFWSPDPGWSKAAEPGNPTSWNQYMYALGDPVNFNDPVGKDDCDEEYGSSCSYCGDAEEACPADVSYGGGGANPGGSDDPADSCQTDADGNLVCTAEANSACWTDDDGDFVCAADGTATEDDDDDDSGNPSDPTQGLVPNPVVAPPETGPTGPGLVRLVWGVVTRIAGPTLIGVLFPTPTAPCDTLTCQGIMPGPVAGRKGERRRTAKPDKPRKHAWPVDPRDPKTRWWVRDPQDPGKRILKPPGWRPDGDQ